jgi:hypothetical protein
MAIANKFVSWCHPSNAIDTGCELRSWNELMKTQANVEAMETIMESMRAVGITPDLTTWNIYINAHRDVASLEDAFIRMEAAGVEPNIDTWNAVLNIQESSSVAVWIFQEIKDIGLIPNSVTISTIFDKLLGCENDASNEVLKIYYTDVVPAFEKIVNHHIAECVIRAFCACNKEYELQQFLELCFSTLSNWPASHFREMMLELCQNRVEVNESRRRISKLFPKSNSENDLRNAENFCLQNRSAT